MKKRLLLGFMMIALVATLVGGATFALFDATATNSNNTFTAGTVALSTEPTTEINVANMAPGDERDVTITVKNDGSLPVWFKVGNVEFTGALGPALSVTTWTLEDGTTPLPTYNELAKDGSLVVKAHVVFDRNAGNTYQDTTGTLSATFNAQQRANNDNPNF